MQLGLFCSLFKFSVRCFFFFFFFSVFSTQYCQLLSIVYSWFLLRVSLTFLIKHVFHWRIFTVKPTIGMSLLRVLVHHFTMRWGLVVIESRESELSYICGLGYPVCLFLRFWYLILELFQLCGFFFCFWFKTRSSLIQNLSRFSHSTDSSAQWRGFSFC